MNVKSFHFIFGFLLIADIAQATSIHSHTQAQSHASQIASHEPIDAISDNSLPKTSNATTSQYIAADSTSAIPKIVTVKKNQIIDSCFDITSIDFSANIHSQILTHNQASQTANHIPINASFVKSVSQSILNAITNQYIAADSTNATNNTI